MVQRKNVSLKKEQPSPPKSHCWRVTDNKQTTPTSQRKEKNNSQKLCIKYYWDQIWLNNEKISNSFVPSYAANCILFHVCQLLNISDPLRKSGKRCMLCFMNPRWMCSRTTCHVRNKSDMPISNVLFPVTLVAWWRVVNKGFTLEAIIQSKNKKPSPTYTSGETCIHEAEIICSLELWLFYATLTNSVFPE